MEIIYTNYPHEEWDNSNDPEDDPDYEIIEPEDE